MRNDPLKFRAYFKAWICFYLISIISGTILGAILGGITGGILGGMGYDIDFIKRVGWLEGVIVSIPISCFTFIWAAKRFIVSRLLPPELPMYRPEPNAENSTSL